MYPSNLFRPGDGDRPPYLAGRRRELDAAAPLAADLQASAERQTSSCTVRLAQEAAARAAAEARVAELEALLRRERSSDSG